MITREIIIATKEPKVFDWLHGYLNDCISHRYGIISASNEHNFNEYVKKPEIVMVFSATDFFGEKIIGVLTQLKKHCSSKLRIILFSVHDIPAQTIARYIHWGADSFLSLRDESEEVIENIKLLLNSKCVQPVNVSQQMDEYRGLPNKPPHLTHREIEVVRCLAQEKTKKEISADLGMSISTVNNHVKNIYRKFGIYNSVGVLKLAMSFGILPIEELTSYSEQVL
jgi:DNA-binding NarL/FixJ family response regulator